MFDKNFNFGANVQFVGQISSGEVGYYSACTYNRGEWEFVLFSGRYEQTQVALYDAKLLKEGDNQQSQKCDKEQ